MAIAGVDATKECSRCLQVLSADRFRIINARGLLRSLCRPCERDYSRDYAEEHKGHRRGYHLQRTFGLTVAEYEAMVAAQGGKCAICRQPERRANRVGELKALAVDHDHVTGQIRGLLCHDCNVTVGLMGEDVERLQAAINYLTFFQNSEVK